jgi:hypothetical protein
MMIVDGGLFAFGSELSFFDRFFDHGLLKNRFSPKRPFKKPFKNEPRHSKNPKVGLKFSKT